MGLRFSTRLWLAWQVLRGVVVSARFDGRTTSLDFDYSSDVTRRLRSEWSRS